MKIQRIPLAENILADNVVYLNDNPSMEMGINGELVVLSDNTTNYVLGLVAGHVDVYNSTHSIGYIYNDIGLELNSQYNQNYVYSSSGSNKTMSNYSTGLLMSKSISMWTFVGEKLLYGNESGAEGLFHKFYISSSEFDDPITAPITPHDTGVRFILHDSGTKLYSCSSGILNESPGYRLNIGIPDTHLISYDVWDNTNYHARFVKDVVSGVASTSGLTPARDGMFSSGIYEIVNYIDYSYFTIGSGVIGSYLYTSGASVPLSYNEINVSGSVIHRENDSGGNISETIWDDDGVTINVYKEGTILLNVSGTSLIIQDGKVIISSTDLTFSGSLHITGTLTVDDATTLNSTTDISGKLTGTGGADLS